MTSLLSAKELAKFRNLIPVYRPNFSVLKNFQDSNFAVIAGPAGAGKDTLRNGLLQNSPQTYVRILSTTSRPVRLGEQEGVDYYFRSLKEIEAGLKAEEYFQVALVHDQQISCMHANEVRKLRRDQIGLGILIVQTEQELRKIKPDIKTIFLIPPSLDVLRYRMQAERVLDSDEIVRRLIAAKQELELAIVNPDYYCLVSEDLSELTDLSNKFLKNNYRDASADQQARQIMKTIHKQL